MQDIPVTNHNLLDEICPATFDDMRSNDGLGSDNMTIIIVDFIQHNGGVNGKPGATIAVVNGKTKTSQGKLDPRNMPAAGVSSKKMGYKKTGIF